MAIILKVNNLKINFLLTIALMVEHMYACGCVWECAPVDLFMYTLNKPAIYHKLRYADSTTLLAVMLNNTLAPCFSLAIWH